MKKSNSGRKGFTLVEIIVVLVILALLAAIAIPSLTGYIRKAQKANDTVNLHTLNSATTCYRLNKVITNNDVFDPLTTENARMQALISEGFLEQILISQQQDVQYVWHIPTQKWLSEPVSDSPPTIAVASVSLNKSFLIVSDPANGGDNASPKTLLATVQPVNASNLTVTWSSSDTAIATVDTNGVVRFVKPGNVVITATSADGSKTATCAVRTQW